MEGTREGMHGSWTAHGTVRSQRPNRAEPREGTWQSTTIVQSDCSAHMCVAHSPARTTPPSRRTFRPVGRQSGDELR